MAGRGVQRWKEWLAGNGGMAGALGAEGAGCRPGIVLLAPGRIETLYRNAAASIGRHTTMADSALAVVLAAGTVPQIAHWAEHIPARVGEMVLFSALLVAPLIWRRRFPLCVFAFASAVALVQWVANIQLAADFALLVYLYTVASRYPMRVGALAATVVEAGTVLAALRWPQTRSWVESFLLLSGPVLAALLFGANVRHRRGALSALTERAEQLERERDQQGRIAAAAERTRIAREMHDVVAHSLSVMVTLSEGAVLKQGAEPERAKEAMRQVSSTGHQALDEMRRLLGVLRTEDDPESRQPQPGMAEIDGLIEQVRATGLAAEATVTGPVTTMPPGAELTVYRIVQEALTNTLKHAVAPTRVSVSVVCRPDSVSVDVHDDGLRGNDRGRSGTKTAGHGLTGMRERAAVYGGTVSAGPGPAGGWHVRAHLPMTATTTTNAPATSGRVR